MEFITVVLEVWLGTLFVFTGCHKTLARRDSIQAVINYRLVPESTAAFVSALLAVWEISTGVTLVAGGTVAAAAGVSAALLGLLFASAATSVRTRGIDIRCGCANVALSQRVGSMTIVRAVVIIASGAFLALNPSGDVTPLLAAPALCLAATPAVVGFGSTRLKSYHRDRRISNDVNNVLAILERVG